MPELATLAIPTPVPQGFQSCIVGTSIQGSNMARWRGGVVCERLHTRAVYLTLCHSAICLCIAHSFPLFIVTVLTTSTPAELQDSMQEAAVPSTPAAPAPPAFTTIKQLRLRSAAAYLPHPDKEAYGGEDAHFVSNMAGGAIGVADGASGARLNPFAPA